MTISALQAGDVQGRARCLYDNEQVQLALDRLAEEISDTLADSNPLVITVMNGGLIPAGHLLTRLHFPLHIDYLHATRYRGKTQGGELDWTVKPQHTLSGRVVLVIDDILDEGITLKSILDYCRDQGAARVYSCVLVEKIHKRKIGCKHADFVGLQIEDVYVFGYGMDYKGYLRNAAGIYAVDE
jgi:hypoxanthine phosphoribosyltransferase